jgi:hypothetical protein
VSLSSGDEVPHIFTRKSRLQPGEFLISSAKRLLQQYRAQSGHTRPGGFGRPVRVYRVVGIYDELEQDGRIIREEYDGFRLLVDLTKGNHAGTIATMERILARLKD